MAVKKAPTAQLIASPTNPPREAVITSVSAATSVAPTQNSR